MFGLYGDFGRYASAANRCRLIFAMKLDWQIAQLEAADHRCRKHSCDEIYHQLPSDICATIIHKYRGGNAHTYNPTENP